MSIYIVFYKFNKCRIASQGAYSNIRGPEKRITLRIRSRIAGL